MKSNVGLRHRADQVLLALARNSQAIVIESLDRLVGTGGKRVSSASARFRALQFELGSVLVEEPRDFIDDGYDLLQRLLGLHREFAQRLFDVLDNRDGLAATHPGDPGAQVLPFHSRRAQTL